MPQNLTPRLEDILRAVVEYHVATGRPVGSALLCREGGIALAPSTVRSELARLERMGYLNHPHTSAGRVPTDVGYRYYVDCLFRPGVNREPPVPLKPTTLEGETEEVMRRCVRALAAATGLLAMVSAPSQSIAAIRHVEVLQLSDELVMAVVITASGGIAKKMAIFEEAVDPGLVDWARSFLNETVCGLEAGSRRLRTALDEAGLAGPERRFLAALQPVFDDMPSGGVSGLYLDGVSRFFSQLEGDRGLPVGRIMRLIDRQDEIMRLLQSGKSARRVYLRIGREMPVVAVQGLSLVAANYGVAHRNLGAVGVMGPTRMDYGAVIGSVEQAAGLLSRFVEERFN